LVLPIGAARAVLDAGGEMAHPRSRPGRALRAVAGHAFIGAAQVPPVRRAGGTMPAPGRIADPTSGLDPRAMEHYGKQLVGATARQDEREFAIVRRRDGRNSRNRERHGVW
jgi:hypothetical protein